MQQKGLQTSRNVRVEVVSIIIVCYLSQLGNKQAYQVLSSRQPVITKVCDEGKTCQAKHAHGLEALGACR